MKRRLLLLLLGALGFTTACESEENGSEPCMYGTPSVNLRTRGKVIDSAGDPIKDIEVSSPYSGIKVQTGADGKFDLTSTEFSTKDMILIFKDIDGPANGGEFRMEEIPVTFSEADRTAPAEGWSRGAFEKSDVDVQLTKQEPAAE